MNPLNYQAVTASFRASANAGQQPPGRFQPVRRATEALSRRVLWTARRDVLLGALEGLSVACYERGEGGTWANVDPLTGGLLIPAPMAKHGSTRWGLHRGEAAILRTLLRTEAGAPWFYDDDSRRWHLDLHDYPTAAHAARWLAATEKRWSWELIADCARHVALPFPTGGRKPRR